MRDGGSTTEGEKLMSLDVGTDPYRDLVRRLKEALECDRATFFMVDRERDQVFSKAATALEIGEIRGPLHRGVVGYVARTGRSLNLKDVYNDPRFDRSVDRRTGYRTKSMLTMAVRASDGSVVAVLQALNKGSGEFSAADEDTMTRFCAEASAILVTRP